MTTDYVKYAKEALTYPSDFAWFGFDEMFETWGFAGINMTGENNISDISNWHCTIEELRREFGDDGFSSNFREAPMKHWACGSVNQLCVRILNENIPHDQIVDDDQITPHFKFVCDIATYLAYEYPVLDDEDYSDRQYAAAAEDIEDFLSANYHWYPVGGKVVMIDDIGNQIIDWLHSNDYDYFDVNDRGVPCWRDDEIIEAVYDLGLDKHETEDDEIFWSEWCEANPSAVAYRKERRLEEIGQLKFDFTKVG